MIPPDDQPPPRPGDDSAAPTLLPGVAPARPPAASPITASPTTIVSPRPRPAPGGDPDERDPLEGAIFSAKYRLERLLGAGGMGTVYAGQHLSLGTPVAIKTLHARLAAADEYVRRFSHEAHAVARLRHPNVVSVLDFGQDSVTGVHYMVMEYLQGEPLAAYLARQPEPPPLAELAGIFLQMLDGLEAAHAEGVVHRDLKPDNVFLTRDRAGRVLVKLVDFGLAHVVDERDSGPRLTRSDVVAGTPDYMSPEQCQSLAVGPSTDIYALGCILTAMLQLRPPFAGDSSIAVISAQLFLPPPPLERPASAEPLPPLLERLRRELLAKRPEQRPGSVNDVRKQFLEAMSPEASAARLPARKGDEPIGGRAERAPSWTNPEATRPPPPPSPEGALVELALVRLTDSAEGVSPTCVTGLAAQRILARERMSFEAVAASPPPALVLDAEARADDAVAWLTALASLDPPPRVLVCVATAGIDDINRLIAAGAADVLPYPISPDVLGRKLARLLRRKR
jgi:eukaryotic-like serine/threonine-protein kinase